MQAARFQKITESWIASDIKNAQKYRNGLQEPIAWLSLATCLITNRQIGLAAIAGHTPNRAAGTHLLKIRSTMLDDRENGRILTQSTAATLSNAGLLVGNSVKILIDDIQEPNTIEWHTLTLDMDSTRSGAGCRLGDLALMDANLVFCINGQWQ